MKNMFALCFATMLWTLGIYQASEPGYLLHSLRRFLVDSFGEKAMNPVIDCPFCMPSLHGLLIVTAWHLVNGWLPWWMVLLRWWFVAAGTVFLNFFFFNLLRIVKSYAKWITAATEDETPQLQTNH